MKGKMDGNTVGLGLGSFLGVVHLAWAVFVASGYAQGLMDWIYDLHFLNNPFTIQIFDVTKATTLVIVTFVVGYVFGWVFAWLWNMVVKK